MSTESKPMRISLVVPVRDEASTIDELVGNIDAQTRRPDEVLFVDGGSVDDTVARLKTACESRFAARVLEAENATPGRGRNIGIAAARYEWVALCDAGNRLEPDWLQKLAEAATKDGTVNVIYGNFEPVINSFFEECAALIYVTPKRLIDGKAVRGPSIASTLLQKTVWAQVGGFPDLRASEDLIFMEEIEKRGFKIGWAHDATIWWRLRPGFRSTFRKFVVYSKHNVQAGRQRYWHYGLARQYIVGGVFVLLALLHSWWWLLALPLILLARAAKNIRQRREGRGLLWTLNPARLFGVAAVLLTIDLATFVGWGLALGTALPARSAPIAGHGRNGE
jgi:glycosyltransferase involved in cell wall biosynthesis